MNIIIFGPPGAGKGTQAKKIKEQFNLNHISTGDLLRSAIENKSEIGLKAEGFIREGKLVPDEIIMEIITKELAEGKNFSGFLLDGFPRNINQAEMLEETLRRLNKKIDHVINLEASEETIIERICGRRICLKCGKIYHIKFSPPTVDNKCDNCGESLTHRDDDKEETIKKRLKVFQEQTVPVFDYYRKKNLLRIIDGNSSESVVFNGILEVLQ